MPEVLFKVDLNKPMTEQESVGHNRWHPDIPAVASVNPGTVFRIECKDWTDGQIHNNDSPEDIRTVNLTIPHVLSGPIHVNGAEPGDLLVVDILDVGTLPSYEWGFTGIFAKENGGGFLTEHYPTAQKAIWDLQGIYARSRHIPDVRFAGIPHPGLIGCAPSHELLATWNKREAELVATDPDRVPALALLPNPKDAILGSLQGGEFDRVAQEACRTIPPANMEEIAISRTYLKVQRCIFPSTLKVQNFRWAIFTFRKVTGKLLFAARLRWLATSICT